MSGSLDTRGARDNGVFGGLWQRPFLFLNLSYFLVFSNISLFYLYPLALEGMGATPEMIGWVMGFFSVATVLTRPLMGKLVGSKGESPVMWMGIIVVLLATIGYVFLQSVSLPLFLVRLVHGVGYSAFISGSFSLVARAVPPEKQGEAYGMVGASIMGAGALAPPVGEILIRHGGFALLYWTAGACALAACLTVLLGGLKPAPGARRQMGQKVRYMPLLKDLSFLFLMLSTLLFANCQSTLVNFLALISAREGVGAGRFFFVTFCVAILALLTMGKVMDRFGKRLFLKLAYPLFALGLFLIPGLVGSWPYLLPALLCGAGMGLLFPAHNALAAGYGTREQKPAAMSFFTSVYDTGFITGAVFSGWIAQVGNLDGLFMVTGSIAVGGLLIVVFSPLTEPGVDPAD
ncbi:MAG: MFS transporter [Deltaproteobacteria bacterium]|nr:MFS transporter [Deltaproteobacteria bacterium]